ncbi:MAG: hypothetical protein GY772_29040, partial [bacterium]|nr:hypothetical protein [bacterium]
MAEEKAELACDSCHDRDPEDEELSKFLSSLYHVVLDAMKAFAHPRPTLARHGSDICSPSRAAPDAPGTSPPKAPMALVTVEVTLAALTAVTQAQAVSRAQQQALLTLSEKAAAGEHRNMPVARSLLRCRDAWVKRQRLAYGWSATEGTASRVMENCLAALRREPPREEELHDAFEELKRRVANWQAEMRPGALRPLTEALVDHFARCEIVALPTNGPPQEATMCSLFSRLSWAEEVFSRGASGDAALVRMRDMAFRIKRALDESKESERMQAAMLQLRAAHQEGLLGDVAQLGALATKFEESVGLSPAAEGQGELAARRQEVAAALTRWEQSCDGGEKIQSWRVQALRAADVEAATKTLKEWQLPHRARDAPNCCKNAPRRRCAGTRLPSRPPRRP